MLAGFDSAAVLMAHDGKTLSGNAGASQDALLNRTQLLELRFD